MKTNKDKLVKISVQGEIHHPIGGYVRETSAGLSVVMPAVGGIVYNVKVGDEVFGLVGDHIEPGVSLNNKEKSASDAMMTFACIGNEARVVAGEAKGAIGYVTGKHGGIEHVIIYFKDEDLKKMAIGDNILIEAYGQGLSIKDFEDVTVQSIDPTLLDAMNIEIKDRKLVIPVTCVIPSYLMGSGIGTGNSYSGDYDLMTGDKEELKKLGLDKLKFGDIVFLQDCDNTHGRGFLRGATSIGVVIHGDCIAHGHGPGITTILTSKKPLLEAKIDCNSNIGLYYEKISYTKE